MWLGACKAVRYFPLVIIPRFKQRPSGPRKLIKWITAKKRYDTAQAWIALLDLITIFRLHLLFHVIHNEQEADLDIDFESDEQDIFCPVEDGHQRFQFAIGLSTYVGSKIDLNSRVAVFPALPASVFHQSIPISPNISP